MGSVSVAEHSLLFNRIEYFSIHLRYYVTLSVALHY